MFLRCNEDQGWCNDQCNAIIFAGGSHTHHEEGSIQPPSLVGCFVIYKKENSQHSEKRDIGIVMSETSIVGHFADADQQQAAQTCYIDVVADTTCDDICQCNGQSCQDSRKDT